MGTLTTYPPPSPVEAERFAEDLAELVARARSNAPGRGRYRPYPWGPDVRDLLGPFSPPIDMKGSTP